MPGPRRTTHRDGSSSGGTIWASVGTIRAHVDPDPEEPLEKIPGHLFSSATQLAGVALVPALVPLSGNAVHIRPR